MQTRMNKRLTRNTFLAALALPFIAAEDSKFGVMQLPCGEITINAAEGADGVSPGTLAMLAYNGGALRVAGYPSPVYVDLRGIDASGTVPVLRDHDRSRIVGQVQYNVVGTTIDASGRLVGDSTDRREIEKLSRDGFKWQASIGVAPTRLEHILAGQTATVNGQTVKGPAFIAREGRLNEISILTIGADAGTMVLVQAEEGTGGNGTGGTGTGTGNTQGTGRLADIRAERERREAIEARAVEYSREPGADLNQIETAMAAAIQAGTTPEAFELQLLRETRPRQRVSTGSNLPAAQLARVVEASLSLHLGASTGDLEKDFPVPVLEAMDANPNFKHGMSFKDAMVFACTQNGMRDVSRYDVRAMLEGAFPIRASGMSTFSLSGIFSNIANKAMRRSFDSVEQVWKIIAAIASVSDFKTRTSYSLTGDMQYLAVPPGGELKHATAGEQAYTNKADTYGRMFALDRRDIINDDLGALTGIPRKLGRGGALKINDVFWTVFLDNASFFTSGNKNYFEGSGTALSIDSLTTAEQMFLDQVDYDGKPLSIAAAILLVSTANKVLGDQLNTAQTIAYGGSTAKLSNNPHQGKYRSVASAYMSNTAYTGNSSTAWYLLADPMDLAVIEVCFLNGKQEPTVETSEADFSQLGVQMRGYHDFGVSKQEKKAGVKSKGAA